MPKPRKGQVPPQLRAHLFTKSAKAASKKRATKSPKKK